MNTKQMSYLIELAQTLNFNQAAENLYISQPTLTYQIKSIEEEVGFQIFNRSKKGVVLTPSGEQFCSTLRKLLTDYRDAVEQGQNFSSTYTEDIVIAFPIRSCLNKLSEAIEIFSKEFPTVNITPVIIPFHNADLFLTRKADIIFLLEEDMKKVPNVNKHSLYKSKIVLTIRSDDELAKKDLITFEDIKDRILMIGGDSPPQLQQVQEELIKKYKVKYINSFNHDMTLINVGAKKGVCLSPDFFREDNSNFKWIPFDVENSMQCNLYTHSDDNRRSLNRFVEILCELYKDRNEK